MDEHENGWTLVSGAFDPWVHVDHPTDPVSIAPDLCEEEEWEVLSNTASPQETQPQPTTSLQLGEESAPLPSTKGSSGYYGVAACGNSWVAKLPARDSPTGKAVRLGSFQSAHAAGVAVAKAKAGRSLAVHDSRNFCEEPALRRIREKQQLKRSQRDKRIRSARRKMNQIEQTEQVRANDRAAVYEHVDRVFDRIKHIRSTKKFERLVDGVAREDLPPSLQLSSDVVPFIVDVLRAMHAIELGSLDVLQGCRLGLDLIPTQTPCAKSLLGMADTQHVSHIYGEKVARLVK